MISVVFRSFFKSIVDNIGIILLMNFAILSLFFIMAILSNFFTPASMLIVLGFLLVHSLVLALGARLAGEMAKGLKVKLSFLKNQLGKVLMDTGFLFLLDLLLVITFSSLSFYWQDENLLSKISFVLLSAGTVVGAWILQFYLAVRVQENTSLRASLRLALTFAVDNIVFSVLVGLASVVLVGITVFSDIMPLSLLSKAPALTVLPTSLVLALFPGWMGVLVLSQTAFFLRCKKYPWTEALEASEVPKKLPWKEILAEEEKRLQPKPRSLARRG